MAELGRPGDLPFDVMAAGRVLVSTDESLSPWVQAGPSAALGRFSAHCLKHTRTWPGMVRSFAAASAANCAAMVLGISSRCTVKDLPCCLVVAWFFMGSWR